MAQQQRTDSREPRDLVKQQDDDRSNGSPAGARQQGALGSSDGSAGRHDDGRGDGSRRAGGDSGDLGTHAPQSQSTRGASPDEANSSAQTGQADERREAERERGGGRESSQGLAGAQGSGGGAERGISQHPDRKDPTAGSAATRSDG